MILSSDEQKALDVIGGDLCADEPLAAKFSIFTRLAAEEDRPPDEDLVMPIRPPVPPPSAAKAAAAVRGVPVTASFRRPRRRQRGQTPARTWTPLFVLAALLLLVILIVTLTHGQ
jgi:hypothetical protein